MNYETTHETETRRVRWEFDELYETVGSYYLDTEEETKAAETWELERLQDGRLVVLSAIVETKCGSCGQWEVVDSLHGITIEPGDDLEKLGDDMLDIPTGGKDS